MVIAVTRARTCVTLTYLPDSACHVPADGYRAARAVS